MVGESHRTATLANLYGWRLRILEDEILDVAMGGGLYRPSRDRDVRSECH